MTDQPTNGQQQQIQVPIVDLGNSLLGEQPGMISCGQVDTPGGKRLAVTVRTPSTTLTVFLQQADAETWARQIIENAQRMSRLVLPTFIPPTDLPGAGR